MKIKEGFILRKIADSNMVIPIGNNIADFNGIISLNETAAFLWRHLKEEKQIEQLTEALVEEYGIARDLAEEDLGNFLNRLRQDNILEMDN